MMKSTIEVDGRKYVSTAVLMSRFEIWAITILRWSKKGLLPKAVRIGQRNFFLEQEVERRIAAGMPY